MLATGGERRDGHRLDQREGIALHDDAILEGAGLGLVGIADEVMRPSWLARHGIPFASGRERSAAATEELGIGDFANDGNRTHGECCPQRLVAALRPIRVDAQRIDHADAAQERAVGNGLVERRRDGGFNGWPGTVDDRLCDDGGAVLDQRVLRRFAGERDESDRCPLACAETRRGMRAARYRGLGGSGGATCGVDADVYLARAGLRQWEERVEAGNGEDLGRRYIGPVADFVHRAGRDPPDPIVHGVQDGEQFVAAVSELLASTADVEVRGGPLGGSPSVDRRSENRLDGSRLDLCRSIDPGFQIHLVTRHERTVGHLVDANRAGLELGRARLRIVGLDGEHVHVDLLGEVKGHEHQTGAK